MLVPAHDDEQLISDIADPHHILRLDVILKAPGGREIGMFPAIVYIEQSDMITRRIMELGFLLVSLILLISRSVEDVLGPGYPIIDISLITPADK